MFFFIFIAKANSVKEIHDAVNADEEDKEFLKEELRKSVEPPVGLLNNQMTQLDLKEQPFKTFPPAADANINSMWQN